MSMQKLSRRTAGFTLVELTIALVILGIVVSTAVAFVARQNSAYQGALDRMVALRNLRYAVTTLSQDLETLGTNVPGGQPAFFYGDDDVITFAADYATNVANDPFAVYYDPDAPGGEVVAPTGQFAIPNASVNFPDTVYRTGTGTISPAEVITFWIEPDTATSRTDDHVLFRQVNAGSRQVVARNILQSGTEPFFRFHTLSNGGDLMQEVGDSLLPVYQSATDSATAARADSVRAVRITLAATDGREGDDESVLSISRLVGFPNAVVESLSTCGDVPILGSTLTAVLGTLSTGNDGSILSWAPAIDETAGEADVVRYVIWRRVAGSTDWGEPFLAIPAGEATYSFEDGDVVPGTSYEYALAAQDCTPSLSPLTTAGPVAIPSS
jgi:prepilin-type N-terminal cleavage/methylation domain-containing protein